MEHRLLTTNGASLIDHDQYRDIPKKHIGTFTATMRDTKGQIEISIYWITQPMTFGVDFKTALEIRDVNDLRREDVRYWILKQDVKETTAVLRSGLFLWGVNKIPACNT